MCEEEEKAIVVLRREAERQRDSGSTKEREVVVPAGEVHVHASERGIEIERKGWFLPAGEVQVHAPDDVEKEDQRRGVVVGEAVPSVHREGVHREGG